MPALSVINKSGKEIETLDLPEKLFGEGINAAVLHQAVVKYHASQRQGTAAVKERGAVSGGGKKPWRQKGTGRARAGSSRAPTWIGGGAVFGPIPRDFNFSLPKKLKRVALGESLNAKYLHKDLLCIELDQKFEKTKEFAKYLDGLKLHGKILAILDGCDESVLRVSRNIRFFKQVRSEDVNAYDILCSNKVLVTKAAFKKLLKRVEG